MEILEFWQTVKTINNLTNRPLTNICLRFAEQLMPLIAKKQLEMAEYLPLMPLIKLTSLTTSNLKKT